MTILVVYSFTMLIIGIIALTRSGLKKVFDCSGSWKIQLRNMKAPDSDAHVDYCSYDYRKKEYTALVFYRTGSFPTLKEEIGSYLTCSTKEGLEKLIDDFYEEDRENYAREKRIEEILNS